jgi:hypothetical protein
VGTVIWTKGEDELSVTDLEDLEEGLIENGWVKDDTKRNAGDREQKTANGSV